MRHILFTALLLCSMAGSAKTEKDSVETGKDPLYLQLFLGVNKSANENLPWTEFTRYPWSTGMFLAVGHEFKPLWGWRAALRINRNKSRNVPVCESNDVWRWSSTSLFADATFDITDAIQGRRLRRAAKAAANEEEIDDDLLTDDERLQKQRDDSLLAARRRPWKFNLKAFVGWEEHIPGTSTMCRCHTHTRIHAPAGWHRHSVRASRQATRWPNGGA